MTTVAFLNGVSAGCGILAGVLFLRFWRDTADRFFLWFALAFWMLAANWISVAFVDPQDEARHLLYVVRLAGFLLILAAIADKNLHRERL
jgi:hypothetical protein